MPHIISEDSRELLIVRKLPIGFVSGILAGAAAAFCVLMGTEKLNGTASRLFCTAPRPIPAFAA